MYKRLEKNAGEDAEERVSREILQKHFLCARARPGQGFKHVIILSDLQTFEHNGHLSHELVQVSPKGLLGALQLTQLSGLVFDLLKCDMRFALQKSPSRTARKAKMGNFVCALEWCPS